MMVVFVQGGDVVEDVFLAWSIRRRPSWTITASSWKGRVIGHAIGNELRENLAVAVLMLQPSPARWCARRCRRSGSPRLQIAGRPGQVADALEAEHRVVDVERHHVDAVIAVNRPGGNPRHAPASLMPSCKICPLSSL